LYKEKYQTIVLFYSFHWFIYRKCIQSLSYLEL
jgi:hypothetical protein